MGTSIHNGYLFCLVGFFLALTSQVSASLEKREEIIFVHKAVEARQGVAVDDRNVYVISNHAIGKYDKVSFQKVGEWSCPEGEPLIHLNAGIVLGGKLYCPHSNYPGVPMTSSVEIWDTETLEHVGSHSFGIMQGSLTWIDQRDGHWYACFAHYSNRAREPNRDPSWTSVVRFDQEWRRLESWVFPQVMIEEFGEYSSSGGAFGPDGRLYVTGHDHKKLYALEFPTAGSALKYLGFVEISAEGQAFCFDRDEDWKLYSILKAEREVIVSRLVNKDR